MPTAAFNTFITTPVKDTNILVEVEPRDLHPVWTAVSGLSNSYAISFNPIVADEEIQGGIYRKTLKFKQDGIALTQMEQAGFVDQIQGSWYHHEGRSIKNLLLWSGRPDKSDWTNVRLSPTSVSPGVYSLDEDGTAADTHFIFQDVTITADDNIIASTVVKKSNRDWVEIRFFQQATVNGFFGYFDLTNGVVGSSGTTGAGATFLNIGISDAGNGYYFCWVKGNLPTSVTAGRIAVNIAEADGDDIFDGLSQESILFRGAQVESANQYNAEGDTYVETRATQVTLPKNDVWIHTDDSSDPEAADAIVSTFRLHFATSPIVVDGIYYEPRLTEESLPDIHQEVEDVFYGSTKLVGEGEVVLNNADGMFDTLSNIWAWRNAKVCFYLGGSGLTHTPGGGGDYEQIGCLLVEDVTPSQTEFSILVRDLQKTTLRELPPNKFTVGGWNFDVLTHFPDLPEGLEGTPVPIFYGKKENITPVRVNKSLENGKYFYYLADPNVQTLYDISEVFSGGMRISSLGLVLGLTLCRFSLEEGAFAVPSGILDDLADKTITCNAKGQPAVGNPWETSTDYLKYYAEIVCDIYWRFLGVASEDIDATAALAADAEAPQEQSIYIDSVDTARSYIRSFELGVMGRTIQSVDGKITPLIWTPFDVPATSVSIVKEDIALFEPDLKIEAVFSKAIGVGDRNPSNNAYNITSSIKSPEIQFHQLDGREEDRQIVTNLKQFSGLQELVGRIVHLTKKIDTHVRIVETGIRLMNVNVGDRILVSFPRASSETGDWDNQLVEVLEVTKRFSPYPEVELVVSDLKGGDVAETLGLWTSDSAPNWATSTDADKASSGYWCDDTGRPDPADATSKNVSLWW